MNLIAGNELTAEAIRNASLIRRDIAVHRKMRPAIPPSETETHPFKVSAGIVSSVIHMKMRSGVCYPGTESVIEIPESSFQISVQNDRRIFVCFVVTRDPESGIFTHSEDAVFNPSGLNPSSTEWPWGNPYTAVVPVAMIHSKRVSGADTVTIHQLVKTNYFFMDRWCIL